MSQFAKGLIKAGFLNKAGKAKKEEVGDKGWKKYIDSLADKDAAKFADEEYNEEASLQPMLDGKFSDYFSTGFPPPAKRFRLVYESFNFSIENMYYWVISQLRRDQSYHTFHKITDRFSASEQSAFWGAAQNRLKIQQDNVSQYLVTIGKMIKDLFQIIRELRIIDERLEIYKHGEDLKSADVTLKGLYVDLVEGASKNPSSVYGLAQQVGFTILPDLFFNTHVHSPEEVDSTVEGMKYNKAIKNVLKRKLLSYIVWKEKTFVELKQRRTFQIKYLRQHWVIIKMYMDWIKPYLRNIRRMQMDERMIESVDIISSFETSMTEIEFLAIKPASGGIHPVIVAHFEYRTKPDMSFQQDNYAHRGPIHVGRASMDLRSYGWTAKQLENYKTYRREEGIELFGMVDESVKAAMDALGDDLNKYLEEAGEPLNKPESDIPEKKKKQMNWGMLDPFISVFKGLGEMVGALIPIPDVSFGSSSSRSDSKPPDKSKIKKAASIATGNAWLTYKNYKKSQRMITW